MRGRNKIGKKLLASVLVLLWALMSVSSVSANLLVNGSFEDPSPTGWDGGFSTYNHATQVYYTGPAPAGCGDIYGWAWGGGTWGSATQTVDLTGMAGNGYTFNAWLAAYYSNDDYAYITLEFFDGADGTGNSLGVVNFDGNNGSDPHIVGSANAQGDADPAVAWALDNWTFYEDIGNFPGGVVSAVVKIESRATNSNGNDAYVDLVNLVMGSVANVYITESGGNTTVTEGSPTGDSYQIGLATEPTADVQITATPGDSQIDLGTGPGNPVIVTFTTGPSGDWQTDKTINVSANDDEVYEGKDPHITIITHTAQGGDYEGITINTVEVSVIDNELICGDWDYYETDLNKDCYVNLLDFALFASEWLDSIYE